MGGGWKGEEGGEGRWGSRVNLTVDSLPLHKPLIRPLTYIQALVFSPRQYPSTSFTFWLGSRLRQPPLVAQTRLTRPRRRPLQFPVGRIHRYLKLRTANNVRIGAKAAVYTSAILEYLTAEVLELAGERLGGNDARVWVESRQVDLGGRRIKLHGSEYGLVSKREWPSEEGGGSFGGHEGVCDDRTGHSPPASLSDWTGLLETRLWWPTGTRAGSDLSLQRLFKSEGLESQVVEPH